jgi:hypothetical protein
MFPLARTGARLAALGPSRLNARRAQEQQSAHSIQLPTPIAARTQTWLCKEPQMPRRFASRSPARTFPATHQSACPKPEIASWRDRQSAGATGRPSDSPTGGSSIGSSASPSATPTDRPTGLPSAIPTTTSPTIPSTARSSGRTDPRAGIRSYIPPGS